MQEIDELIDTCEILRDAVWAKDKEEGFEAVTVLPMKGMRTFGHDRGFMAKIFPMLERLKDLIQSGEFDEATPYVLAFLVRLRAADGHDRDSAS
jgi:hypothetical protein